MYLLIRTQTIAQRCCHQAFSNIKFYSKIIPHESNSKVLSSIQTHSLDSKHQKLNEELIYSGRLAKSIKLVKIFSLSTSFLMASIQPVLLMKIMDTGSTPTMLGTMAICGIFGILSPMLLHIMTNRYTLDIYYDRLRDVYIASKYTFLAKITTIEFKPEDVTKPKGMEIMTTCLVKNKPFFFDYNDFKGLHHYRRIMGYDKPMDFGINDIPQSINARQVKSQIEKDVK